MTLTKILLVLTSVFSSGCVYAQSQTDSTDVKRHLSYQDSTKCCPDTAQIKSSLRFIPITNKKEGKTSNTVNFKLKKQDPYKEKIKDWKLIDIIGSHMNQIR